MLYVGGLLFLGEWLFGSIGWGFAHGVLFGVAIIVNLAFAILGARGSRLAVAFVLAAGLTVAIALLCGSNVAYNTAAGAASGLAQPLGTPGVVALLGGVVIGVVLFTLLFARAGGRNGAIGGFFLGAILGALVGWLIAGAPWTWPPAVGFAITIGLVAWSCWPRCWRCPASILRSGSRRCTRASRSNHSRRRAHSWRSNGAVDGRSSARARTRPPGGFGRAG